MNLFERIEDYINGAMSSEEKLRFEEDMANNEEIAEATMLYKTIEAQMKSNASNSDDVEALKGSLSLLGKQYFQTDAAKVVSFKEEENGINNEKKTTGKRVFLWRLGIAAALLGVIVFGAVLFLKTKDKETKLVINNHSDTSNKPVVIDTAKSRVKIDVTKAEKQPDVANHHKEKKQPASKTREVLFAQNFEPDVVPENKTGPLNEAFESYKNKRYEEAIASLDKTDLNNETRGDDSYQNLLLFYAHYYKGISYMAVNNCGSAIPELKTAISKSPDRISEIKAEWYLALAYVKTGNLNKAKLLLQPIAKNHINAVYKIKAIQLLSELH